MDKTPNYNLEKPADNDFYNIALFNRNFDKIDEALKDISGATIQTKVPDYGSFENKNFGLTTSNVVNYVELDFPKKYNTFKLTINWKADNVEPNSKISSPDLTIYNGINRITGFPGLYETKIDKKDNQNMDLLIGENGAGGHYHGYYITSIELIQNNNTSKIRIGGKSIKHNNATSPLNFKIDVDWFAWE